MRTRGFADDDILLASGSYLPAIMENLQEAADKAVQWGNENGLTFSVEKTVVVVFTHKYDKTIKRDLGNAQILEFNGKKIEFSQTVKPLGVILDR